MKILSGFSFILMIATVGGAIAAPSSDPGSQVRYTHGKDVNFEELLIQGQLKRPELSVVTGNVQEGADGLLRLRQDFIDRLTADAGEEAGSK